MRLEPEDLIAQIENYQKYQSYIKRLNYEILEVETELNHFPGSIIKLPDGSSAVGNFVSSRQNELFFKLDDLMTDKNFYMKRIELVNKAIEFEKENKLMPLIEFRANGFTFGFIADRINKPVTTVVRVFKKNVENFLKMV